MTDPLRSLFFLCHGFWGFFAVGFLVGFWLFWCLEFGGFFVCLLLFLFFLGGGWGVGERKGDVCAGKLCVCRKLNQKVRLLHHRT